MGVTSNNGKACTRYVKGKIGNSKSNNNQEIGGKSNSLSTRGKTIFKNKSSGLNRTEKAIILGNIQTSRNRKNNQSSYKTLHATKNKILKKCGRAKRKQ